MERGLSTVTSIQQFFKWGLDRDIPDLIEPPAAILRDELLTLEEALRVAFVAEPQYLHDLPWINLGPGDKKVVEYKLKGDRGSQIHKGTVGVGPKTNKLTDVPWIYPQDLPFEDESVGAVHAHQFLEHFDGDDAIGILREIERVLVPGGVAFVTVPYQGSSHWGQALDHKSTWNEETWNWLFDNEYYDHQGEPWKLKVHACFIMGIVIRNLDLFTQLVKE
jgi:SAM-dependent methyltransferase